MISFFIYIVECRDGYLYTGITNNLRKRIGEHNSGKGSVVIKNRQPVRLVYHENYPTRKLAAIREKEIKSWRREKKLDLIKGLH